MRLSVRLNDPELAHESCGVAFLNHLVLRNMLWHARVHLGMIWIDSAQIIPKWTFMHRIALSQLFNDNCFCRWRQLFHSKNPCCFFAETLAQTSQIMQAKPRQESLRRVFRVSGMIHFLPPLFICR